MSSSPFITDSPASELVIKYWDGAIHSADDLLRSDIHIIDNFHNHPMDIRQSALMSDYQMPNNRPYGGGVSNNAVCPREIYLQTKHCFAHKLNAFVFIRPDKMQFRYSTKSSIAKTICHTDQGKENWQWSAVIFLTPDEYCQGGTRFFRNIPSGYTALKSGEALRRYSKLPEYWDEVFLAEMKFNRCVLFRARLFHAAAQPFFGREMSDARVTQVQVLNVLPGKSA